MQIDTSRTERTLKKIINKRKIRVLEVVGRECGRRFGKRRRRRRRGNKLPRWSIESLIVLGKVSLSTFFSPLKV